MSATRTPAATGLVFIALVAVAACFSERSSGVTQAEGDCAARLPSEASGAKVVFIRDFAFLPATVTVGTGDRVVWINCGEPKSDAHTSTSDASGWSSPLLAPGESYIREFDGAGSFPYHCEPHPGMKGTVVVQAGT